MVPTLRVDCAQDAVVDGARCSTDRVEGGGVPRTRAAALAATAQLESWRLPVTAALQPVLVVDAELQVTAASASATRLLLLPAPGRPLREAAGLQDVAGTWESTPFARAVATGEAQRARLELPTAGVALEVVASPLFGERGAIGAVAFLTSC